MKKIILCVLAIALSLMTITLCACEKEPVRSGRVSSKSYGKTFSYVFPYLTSASTDSSLQHNSRPLAGAVSYTSEYSKTPSFDTALGVVHLISNIGEVTKENYIEKEQLILYVTDCFNALSEEDKLRVDNYEVLSQSVALFNNYLNEDMLPIANEFKQKMSELTEFIYTKEFKLELDLASEILNRLHQSFVDSVAEEKNTLDKYIIQYNDNEKAENVKNAIDSLPTTINDINVGQFKVVVANYKDLTQTQKELLPNDYAEKISNLEKVLKDNYSNTISLAISSGIKNEIFSVNNASLVNGNFKYNNQTISKGAVLTNQSSISVSIPYGGKVTLYLANSSDKLNVIISKGSTKLYEVLACEYSQVEYVFEEIGNYSITFENSGSTTLYAIDFC